MSLPSTKERSIREFERAEALETLSAAVDIAERIEADGDASIDKTTLLAHLRVLQDDLPALLERHP